MVFLDSNIPVEEHLEKPVDNSFKKYWRQFISLHVKRFRHSRRNYKALFAEVK